MPNVLIALLGTAAVTAAVPAVSQRVRGGGVARGHRLLRTVSLVVLSALAATSLALAAVAPAVVRVPAPGFGPEQVALAGSLSRILLLGRRLGVAALAWGFVLGSLLRVLVQLPSLRRTGLRWGPIRLREPGTAAIAGLLPVIVLGHLASNVNTLVDRLVGSTLDEGAIAALNYAYRLVTLPHGLLVLALLQVLHPALGAVADRRAEFRALTDRGASVLVAVLVPAAGLLAALAALAVPVVTLVSCRCGSSREPTGASVRGRCSPRWGRNLVAVVPAVAAAAAVVRIVGAGSTVAALLAVALGGGAGLGLHVLVLRAPELGAAAALTRQLTDRVRRRTPPTGGGPTAPDG